MVKVKGESSTSWNCLTMLAATQISIAAERRGMGAITEPALGAGPPGRRKVAYEMSTLLQRAPSEKAGATLFSGLENQLGCCNLQGLKKTPRPPPPPPPPLGPNVQSGCRPRASCRILESLPTIKCFPGSGQRPQYLSLVFQSAGWRSLTASERGAKASGVDQFSPVGGIARDLQLRPVG